MIDKNENNLKETQVGSDQIQDLNSKKKGRLISYLPALFIALITISLLLLIILGTIFGGGANPENQERALHSIEFTGEIAAFDENYTYVATIDEEPVFVIEQGFRWDSLKSEVHINIPSYEESVSIDVDFGLFNLKTYGDSESSGENYVFKAYDSTNSLLNSKALTKAQNDSQGQVVFEYENINYISIVFNEPITTIGEDTTSGYLYLKSISVHEILNYSK